MITGRQPDLIIWDDLEYEQNTKNKKETEMTEQLSPEMLQFANNMASMVRQRELMERPSKHSGNKRMTRSLPSLAIAAQTRESGVRKILTLLSRATNGAVSCDNDAALALMERKGL